MKLYFRPIEGDWAVRTGYGAQYEAFLSNVPQSGNGYSIVTEPANADYIIHPPGDHLTMAPVGRLLRPLSRLDVRSFAWDSNDGPTGRRSGFYCSLPRQLFEPERHCSISYPIPFNELVDAAPASDALRDFGFMGNQTSGVRARMLQWFAADGGKYNGVITEGTYGSDWNVLFQRDGSEPKQRYARFLRETKFVVCPRGFGVGTVRMFEAMQAGRVPVILSDGYVMPNGIDWDSCSLRIAEIDFRRIPEVVEANLHRWPQMAANALAVWQRHFSNTGVIQYLADNLRRLEQTASPSLGRSLAYSGKVAAALAEAKARPTLGRLAAVVRSGLRG